MKNFIFFLCFAFAPCLALSQKSVPKEGKVIKKELKKREILGEEDINYIRPLSIKIDGGWNAIAGAGFITSIYPTKNIAVDLGLGYGLKGFKYGLQSRYFLNSKKHTPYLGLGISRSISETGVTVFNSTFTDSDGTVTEEFLVYSVNNVNHLRLSVGYEFFRKKGFVLDASLGYAWVLNPVLNILEGDGERTESEFDFLYGNGVIYSISLGYSFKFRK